MSNKFAIVLKNFKKLFCKDYYSKYITCAYIQSFKPLIMKKILQFFLLLFAASPLLAQSVQSPEQFLGYPIGSRFTPHHRVVAYFEHLAKSASSRLQLINYGESYEHRPLFMVVLSAPENMNKLEEIRTNNLKMTGLMEGAPTTNIVPITWLSYAIHGNEAVSPEAAMLTAHELLTSPKSVSWLQNSVVVIDPCLNPDGHSRYVNWYAQVAGESPNVSPYAREHYEPSPSGRYNHYSFDMNRDWAWQSQKESQARVAIYQQWMPQVHADFHEMGANQPYYFAPAAEPYHNEVTAWQREFQTTIGKNHAQYFDKNNWLYFTKETFDLLYPSYGDTWPTFHGAIGMTYEQGGSGRAGLGIIIENGDTLTLTDRIAHHHVAGLSTVEATAANKDKVLQEYKKYFETNNTNPSGTYKTYVISADNEVDKVNELLGYLDRQQIRYGYVKVVAPKLTGYNYFTNKEESFSLQKNDIVINTHQPKSVLVKVLFNPKTVLADSATYDATAWAIPYSYGLKSYALTQKIDIQAFKGVPSQTIRPSTEKPYAYIAEWKSFKDLQFLVKLLNKGIKVRFAEKAFSLHNKKYGSGTITITRADNELVKDLDNIVTAIATELNQPLDYASTGFANDGADLGSNNMHFLKKPHVGLLTGDGVQTTAFGELWHYFDQQLGYPVTVVNSGSLGNLKLSEFDVIILPDGYYSSSYITQLRAWVQQGGKLIIMESANNQFADNETFDLKKASVEEKPKDDKTKKNWGSYLQKYGNRERSALSEYVAGSIFKVTIDNTHPLGYGYDSEYYSLRQITDGFEYLKSGWNVGVIKEDAYIDGFTGYKAKQKLKNSLAFGVSEIGRGTVVHLIDNPIFRSSWANGRLMMGNAVFFVGQ